jgi:hypothetical protein
MNLVEFPERGNFGCRLVFSDRTHFRKVSDLPPSREVIPFEMWDCIPALTPMKPGTRLTKEQSNASPDPAFHRSYRGIVGSLGYLVNMTRPDLAWSYSELSKYVQYPGQAHMDAALHVLRYLRGTYDQAILYQHVDTLVDTLWGLVEVKIRTRGAQVVCGSQV